MKCIAAYNHAVEVFNRAMEDEWLGTPAVNRRIRVAEDAMLTLYERICDCPDCVDYDEPMDGDHESGLASAGFGTDEDYGGYGGDDW